MISAKSIQEEYRRHLNRIYADADQRINVIDADGFINEAIDLVFENYAIKFESNSFLRNTLRQLEVKKYKYKPKNITKVDKDTSKINYPDRFYLLTRQSLTACKDDCVDEKNLDLAMLQSSDLNSALRDPNWEPSFEWEQALVEDAGDSLYIYHNCKFKIKEVEIDYLMKPNHIATPSLIKNGASYIKDGKTITSDINFEMDSTFFWRKAVAVAVLLTQRALGDVTDFQTQFQVILGLDKLNLN